MQPDNHQSAEIAIGRRNRNCIESIMNAKIEIPSALQKFVNNQQVVDVPVGTVKNVFHGLISEYGELQNHLYDEDGKIRSFINIYLNDEDIRYAQNLDTEVKEGDILQIVPSIAGGC